MIRLRDLHCEVCCKGTNDTPLYHVGGQRWGCKEHVKLLLRDQREIEAKQQAMRAIVKGHA